MQIIWRRNAENLEMCVVCEVCWRRESKMTMCIIFDQG